MIDYKRFEYESESRGCNLCGADNASVISSQVSFDQVKYSHVRCKKCGLIYSSPMPRLDNGALDQMALELWYDQFLSKSRQFYDQHFKRYREHNRLRVEALEKYIKPGRLLEVGCGNAYFLAAARERGWEARGVEICRDLCRYVKEYFKLDIYCGTLEGAGFEDSYFDAVYLNNILEHVPDPAGFLKEVYRVLKDEGVIFTSVPNTKDLLDGLRRAAGYLGLKGIWKGYLDPPMHLYAYSPRTLKLLLEKCGFRVLKLFTVGEGNKEYFPDFSKASFKKAVKKSISFAAIPLRRGASLNTYAIKDRCGKV